MSKTGPKIYLLGWYGYENSGDDALLSATVRLIAETVPDVEMIIQTPKHGRLPPLPELVKITHPGHWFKGQVVLSKISRILRSDALVFGGGSTMADVNKARMNGLRFKHHICRLAKLKRIPVIFYALGLGPLVTQKGKVLAQSMLNMADLVEVRDSVSYDLCKKLNISSPVVRGFDPAVLIAKQFTALFAQKERSDSDIPRIGISLSKSSGTVANQETQQRLKIKHIVAAIRNIAVSKPVRIAGIEMCGHHRLGDGELIKRLLSELEDVCEVELISYRPDPVDMMRQFVRLNGVISERLHAAIYAYALGIPFAVVPYHSKCVAFAEDVGVPEICCLDYEMPVKQIEQILQLQLTDRATCLASLPIEQAYQMAHSGRTAVVDKLKRSLPIK